MIFPFNNFFFQWDIVFNCCVYRWRIWESLVYFQSLSRRLVCYCLSRKLDNNVEKIKYIIISYSRMFNRVQTVEITSEKHSNQWQSSCFWPFLGGFRWWSLWWSSTVGQDQVERFGEEILRNLAIRKTGYASYAGIGVNITISANYFVYKYFSLDYRRAFRELWSRKKSEVSTAHISSR